MAVKIVKLRLRGTRMAVMRLNRQMAASSRAAMLDTAQFGLTAVERQISRTRPRPVAGGTYRSAWSVKKTRKGAILGNSTKQAVQVEVGRAPGSPPPLDPLVEWVKQKRLVKPVRVRKPKATQSGVPYSYNSKKAERSRARSHKSFLKRSKANHDRATAIAARIAKSIGRKGVKGHYILAKSMPRIQRFMNRQLAKNTKSVIMKHRG